MSLPVKKARDLTQLPTLSYEIKLNLPINLDSNPQEISFLDLIANDTKFKNDKESLELVLSSYVKACGKQSVKEILAEHDTLVEDNASLSDIIHALMDSNDHQNANLGVGYNDPDDDDSFIDDSVAAQDIIPKNVTNERDGFYVNEKHQPINARYLSDASDSDSGDEENENDDDDDESDDSEKEEKQNKKRTNNQDDGIEKVLVKKSKTDDDITPTLLNTKRKRSISEVAAPPLSINSDDKNKTIKPVEEPVKKIAKLNETPSEQSTQNCTTYVLPNEMDNDIKPSIENIVKLIKSSDPTMNNIQKKIERLFNSTTCRELLDLVKKLHRHTNAHRQLVFDILSTKTGIYTSILLTRARLLLLNDYEPSTKTFSLNELKEKLKIEINRSLEIHIQAHNQAVKEWQQKMVENPSKDKNRGPRKNFRLHKAINELIIRCIDRKLETMTIFDSDSLESFLHEHIVSLWEKPGWMTAKKIISEVIRLEYRPLRDPNPPQTQPLQAVRSTPTPITAERVKKEPQTIPALLPPPPPPPLPPPPPSLPSSPKISNSNISPIKVPQQQHVKVNDISKSSSQSLTNNNNQTKAFEMATRVATNPIKQHTSRPSSTDSVTSQVSEQSSNKINKSDIVRPIAKPSIVSQPESSTKRNSTPNFSSVIDLTMDLFSQYKKSSNESSSPTLKQHTHSHSNKDSSSSSQRSSSTVHNSKQQFATKLPSEKLPAGSFLKEALSGAAAPKMSTSPLTVDNMLNKSQNSPKTNTNTSSSKSSTTIQSPTTTNTQRSSTSSKSHSNRHSTDFTSTSHRIDQQIQQQLKTPSSSNRSQSAIVSPSSSISPAASRRPTTGFTSAHEQQSNRGHSSQISIPPTLSSSIQWDSATLQLAAALANPQLLSSGVFDSTLFNSVFGTAPNMIASSQSSSSSSSSRHQHSQNTNNNRRT
ncbi:unnamed protein product [Adineta steineri]|uniref:Hpc2-related domain-containing protein n=1 Tax=Adineta steineri TaxID=433720 RepID=A0A818NS56_9BILA|nr:unnamed protein product [Adineta steineri]